MRRRAKPQRWFKRVERAAAVLTNVGRFLAGLAAFLGLLGALLRYFIVGA
jgi:hypothetical protein